jgi:hypothetical protein
VPDEAAARPNGVPWVPVVGQAELTPVVRAALGRPGAEVVSWRSEPVGYVRVWQGSGGVERFGGLVRDGGQELSWSCVRKVVRAPEAASGTGLVGGHDPSAPGYWRREAELFRGGLLGTLPDDERQLRPGPAVQAFPQPRARHQLPAAPGHVELGLEQRACHDGLLARGCARDTT